MQWEQALWETTIIWLIFNSDSTLSRTSLVPTAVCEHVCVCVVEILITNSRTNNIKPLKICNGNTPSNLLS